MKETKRDKEQRSRMYRAIVVAIIVMFLAGVFGILWNSGKSTMHTQKSDSKQDAGKEIRKGQSEDKGNNSDARKEKTGEYQTKRLQNVKYPEEAELMKEGSREPNRAFLKNLIPFYEQTMRYTLLNEKKENIAYSPVNLYLCMAMLSEMTDGQAEQEILDALGQTSIESVRKQSRKIWNSIYRDSNISKCILADSVWLRDDISYNKDVLKILADNYYASTYQGKMGTQSMNQAVRKWINSATKNLLGEQAEQVETHDDTVLMLLSTSYFYDQWLTKFSEDAVKSDTFYNADGSRSECDFMKQVLDCSVYEESDFIAVTLEFESGKTMNIFLPKETVTLEDMLKKNMEKILHISSELCGEEAERGRVTLSLPKFEITTEKLDFIPAMKKMGITKIFLGTEDNFQKLLGESSDKLDSVYVDKVEQATKIAVDEKGCCAASFTVVEMRNGAAMGMNKEYTVNCNRPFFFVINNQFDGIPVFAGAVYKMD